MDRRPVARGVLALAIMGALALQLPAQLGDLERALPAVRLWATPEAQARLVVTDAPYDLLRAADAALPREATVLLVTDGDDVRHRDYTTFHRALYDLAPRPVRWITPAPGDGTWEARWWTTAPLTAAAICAETARANATHILLVALPEPAAACDGASWRVAALPGGTLVTLAGEPSAPVTPPRGATGLAAWWPLAAAMALAVPFLLGAALVAVARRRGLALGGAAGAGVAWALGTGAVTLSDAGLGALGLPFLARQVLLTGAAGAAGAWLLRGRARGVANVRPPWRSLAPSLGMWQGLLVAVIAAQVALVTVLAVGRPLSVWDGWAHWGMKARVLFFEGRISEAIYADPTRASTHLAYPLHVPVLEAWLYGWLGTPDDRLVGLLGIATFASLLAVAYGALRHWGLGRTGALAAVAVLGSMAHVWRLSAAGFADVPLALLVSITVVLLVEWLRHGEMGALLPASLAAGLLGWTKAEGLVLLGVLVALLVVAGFAALPGTGFTHGRVAGALRHRARLAVVGLVAGGAALSGGWWIFMAAQPAGGAEYELSAAAIMANIDRLPTIIAMQGVMLAGTVWSFVWLVAAGLAVADAVARVRGRAGAVIGAGEAGANGSAVAGTRASSETPASDGPSVTWLLPATAALGLATLSGAYLVTTFAPFTAQVLSSGSRLALQVLPLTVLWVALQLHRWLGPAAAAPRARPGSAPPSEPVRLAGTPAAASGGPSGQG